MPNADPMFWQRPVLGFIVEGDGEYKAFPSLAAHIVGQELHVQCLNAGGYGGITANLAEQLTDLVATYHPHEVIVALDLGDVLKAGLCPDCLALVTLLRQQIADWEVSYGADSRLQPLPEQITIVLQCPKLEAWMIADAEALNGKTLIELEDDFAHWSDVDTDVSDPAAWLLMRMAGSRLKCPKFQKACLSAGDPQVMAARSRSFRKFVKEVQGAYSRWEAARPL